MHAASLAATLVRPLPKVTGGGLCTYNKARKTSMIVLSDLQTSSSSEISTAPSCLARAQDEMWQRGARTELHETCGCKNKRSASGGAKRLP